MIKKMLSLFKKPNQKSNVENSTEFDISKTALILAYEVARSDGDIDAMELDYLKGLIDSNESKDFIIDQLDEFTNSSTSFYDHIKEINQNCSKEQKEGIIRVLWDVAYSDNFLEVHEEKIVRRIADLINIKDIRVLKLKDDSKKEFFNN